MQMPAQFNVCCLWIGWGRGAVGVVGVENGGGKGLL